MGSETRLVAIFFSVPCGLLTCQPGTLLGCISVTVVTRWKGCAGVALASTFAPQRKGAGRRRQGARMLDNCGVDSTWKDSNCMYIDGSGLKSDEIRGWSTNFARLIQVGNGNPVYAHEQVTGPGGGTICDGTWS